ncbi:hypothetical protein J4460_03120 [Candidatus Woesearchaeota archaeon]|nr:MAG: hypothetical protein QS99_C0006G0045 [archaeon GW2011_AR4]MBS3129638.1 hypothetical protein [Candidatus Woesearchaeota archaeon]HIH37653.1 hypothetical protein [Candidatus Woesearchaeota archaeon]HIH48814.1 hypothetical protein [Candidatus Woesearchaeota archaeon]HIJ02948.1 hypothetical protein [Candidatus Woesearchaeota archaeon]
MGKKGYFFVLDMLFGVTILLVGISLIFTNYISAPSSVQSQSYAQDLLTFLGTDLIKYNSDVKHQMVLDGKISDQQHTIAQQLGIWQFLFDEGSCPECKEDMAFLVDDVMSQISNPTYGVELYFQEAHIESNEENDEVVYADPLFIYSSEGVEGSYSKSQQVIVSSQIVIADYQNQDIIGPYIMKVFVWEK